MFRYRKLPDQPEWKQRVATTQSSPKIPATSDLMAQNSSPSPKIEPIIPDKDEKSKSEDQVRNEQEDEKQDL